MTVVGFWGAYPDQGEATSSYLFEKDNYRLLVDCGSGAMAQLPKYVDPYDLNAVLLSHYHQDHIADVGVLQYYQLVQNQIRQKQNTLPIYGHDKDQAAFSKLTHRCTEGIAFQPNETLSLGPFAIDFLKTTHPVTCFAMRITDGEKTVVYTADSSYQDEFIPFSKGADLLITDCSFYENQDGNEAGHMNSKECALIAAQANVDILLLSHHPHFGNRTDLLKEAKNYYDEEIHLATSGFKW